MRPIDKLLAVMQDLRHPEQGCPWDLRQTSASIAPHTLDETHEVLDAIERGDTENLKEELGDLLFNIVFHARIAAATRPDGVAHDHDEPDRLRAEQLNLFHVEHELDGLVGLEQIADVHPDFA